MPEIEIVYCSTDDNHGIIKEILVPPGYTVRQPIGFLAFRIEAGPERRDFGVRIPVINACGMGTSLDEAVKEATRVIIDQVQYLGANGGEPVIGIQKLARQWYKDKIEYNPPNPT